MLTYEHINRINTYMQTCLNVKKGLKRKKERQDI